MKMTLMTILILFTSLSRAAVCTTTPTQCFEMEQRKNAEAIRLKQEREEATFRQQQLELQNAQLREMQEQRAVMEEDLASQQRMEEMRVKELEDAQLEKEKAQKTKTTNEQI